MSSLAFSFITYQYDTYGQLIRETNRALDKIYEYEYNSIGNVERVRECPYSLRNLGPAAPYTSKLYTYDTTHPDRLINYNGTAISYNAIGCPTTYNGYNTTWTRGKLTKLAKGNFKTGITTYNYTYNALGQRISRSYTHMPQSTGAAVIGMVLSYTQTFRYDEAGRLIYESKSIKAHQEADSSETIVYLYDDSGVIGLVDTVDGVSNTYYLQRNLLGDVVAIYDVDGTKVAAYAYDAWGNCTITYSTKSIASRNPIRYRGYYYDQDTKLYYLNARYYCPEWRRFISPDSTEYIDSENANGLNLYTYCGNDSVNYVDPSGHLVILHPKSNKLGLFGCESRESAGWESKPYFINGYLGRIGFSSYLTETHGQQGVLYGFGGITTDIMNLSGGTTYYGGLGVNLFNTIGAEVQFENLGIGAKISIGNFSIAADINLAGGTSITVGFDKDLGNGKTQTKAFTIGLNTVILGAVGFLIYAVKTGIIPIFDLLPA